MSRAIPYVLYGALYGSFDFNSDGSSGNTAVIDTNSFTGTGFVPGPSSPAVGITFDGGFAVAIITRQPGPG